MKIIVWSVVAGVIAVSMIASWRRRSLRIERQAIADRIKPPVQKFGKLPADEYDAKLRDAERRRVDAEELRRRAALVDAGEPVLREVRRIRA